MKVVLLQENLNNALRLVLRAVSSRGQLPILNNVLIKTENGRLKLQTTDLSIAIASWVGTKIIDEGAITVPCKMIAEFIASLPAEKVTLEAKNGLLSLKSGKHKADINGLAASEFPIISPKKGGEKYLIPVSVFEQMIKKTAFAAAADEGRPILTGVLTLLKKGLLTMAATDGYRLSKIDKKIESDDKQSFSLVIPARSLLEVSKSIVEEDEGKNFKMEVFKQEGSVVFSSKDIEVITKTIEGKFPDYEKIIPQSHEAETVVDCQELERAARIASIFARDSANIIRLSVEKDKLLVSANTAEVGSNVTEVDCKTKGKEGKIAFNSRYLLDFLAAQEAEEISFEFAGPLSPGVFKGIKSEDFLHIIMPVRVQE